MKLRANPTDKSESSLKDCERLGLVRTSAEYAEEVRFDDVLALRDAYRGMVHAVQKVNAITAIRMDQVSPIQSTSPEPTGVRAHNNLRMLSHKLPSESSVEPSGRR